MRCCHKNWYYIDKFLLCHCFKVAILRGLGEYIQNTNKNFLSDIPKPKTIQAFPFKIDFPKNFYNTPFPKDLSLHSNLF